MVVGFRRCVGGGGVFPRGVGVLVVSCAVVVAVVLLGVVTVALPPPPRGCGVGGVGGVGLS